MSPGERAAAEMRRLYNALGPNAALEAVLLGMYRAGESSATERAAAEIWGVWCVEDRGWCMTGTREEAEAALPEWASGRAADVDPAHFHYEMRKVPS
jgi:hypothetical protein